MTKDQNIKATKLLGLLCEKGNLTKKEVSLFFKDNVNEASFICNDLEDKGLLHVIWLDANRIAAIDKTKKTFDEYKIRISKRNKFISKIKKINKHTIWVTAGLITFLTILSLLFQNFEYLKKYLIHKDTNSHKEVPITSDSTNVKTDLNEQ